MQKLFTVSLFFILSFVISFGQEIQDQQTNSLEEIRTFQPAAMQEDFNYLRKALEETHPGLYMHHTKEAMQRKMDSLYDLLNKPMAFLDFYKIIAYLVAEVKCEHTYCNPYGDDYKKRLVQWKMIPIQPHFTHDKAYVVINATSDTSIHFGDEILSINHHPIDSIKHVLYQYMPSDGNMESSKEGTLQNFSSFNIYYHLFIEQAVAFDMEFKTADGTVLQRGFNKPPVLSEVDKLALANPNNKEVFAFSKRNSKNRKIPYRLEINKDKNTAIIYAREFGGDRDKVFKQYDDFFTKIKGEKVTNVVIDLSYNGGGEEEYACELLRYLIDTPTRFIEKEYLINMDDVYFKMSNVPKEAKENKKDFIDTLLDGKFYVKPLTKYSMELKVFQPKPNGFKGNVYFLVNGGASSAASTCVANAKSHHLATIVGDETAGSFAGGGSTNGLDLTLPNSKITAHTSIVYCTFSTSGADKDHGVIPDYYFVPTFLNITNYVKSDVDIWQAFIYDLISKKK
jgi:hypothetical protein